jgi:hypothetical protein
VDEYLVQSATLCLKHNYPPSSKPKIALVNVQVILDTITRKEVEVGSWLNVIGYVERRDEKEKGIFVQAIVIWDAGDVDLVAYEKAVRARQEAS